MSIETGGGGDESSKRKREPNFNKWEDHTLCKCYINTTCDPTVGNNQKGLAFWRKVHAKFALVHSQTHISVKQNEQVRSLDQLMQRFNRNIKVDIMVYNKHYIHIHNEKPSGVPVEQYYPELICARYKEVEGKAFRFAQCVDTLHSLVKFSPDNTPALVPGLIDTHRTLPPGAGLPDDDDDDVESSLVVTEPSVATSSTPSTSGRRPTNMAGSVMGSHMRRPIGTKRAKAAAAVARRSGGGNNSGGEEVEEPLVVDLTTTAAEMAAGFIEMNSNNKKKDAFDMKAKEFDMKAKVFDMFMSLGKKDVAEKVANTLLEYCINSSTATR
jgi:hypothetical protein